MPSRYLFGTWQVSCYFTRILLLLPSRRYPFGTWLLSSTLRVLRMISWWLGQWPLAVAEILVRQSLGPRSLRGWCIVARRRCHASARRNSLHKAEPTPDEFLSPFGFDLCKHLYTYLAWDVELAHEILHTTWDKMRYFARVSRLGLVGSFCAVQDRELFFPSRYIHCLVLAVL